MTAIVVYAVVMGIMTFAAFFLAGLFLYLVESPDGSFLTPGADRILFGALDAVAAFTHRAYDLARRRLPWATLRAWGQGAAGLLRRLRGLKPKPRGKHRAPSAPAEALARFMAGLTGWAADYSLAGVRL